MVRWIYVCLACMPLLVVAFGCGNSAESGTSSNEAPKNESTPPGNEPPVDGGGTDKFVADVKPLLDGYCMPCHASGKPAGGKDIGALATGADAKAQMAMVSEMVHELEEKKMPPPNGKALGDEDRAKLVAGLKASIE